MNFSQDRSLLFSRNDPLDPRLGDVAQMPSWQEFEKTQWDWAVIGLPDDRGVVLNSGRAGAAEGPTSIRNWLYRLVPPKREIKIADLGDLEMTDDLHADHQTASDAIAIALGNAAKVAIIGGGHDWAFSPIAALLQGGSAGFVNFDAHLDVRPSKVHHSGTSYWRALEGGVRGSNAVWYGVQPSAAAEAHRSYVTAHGGSIIENGPILPTLAMNCDYVDISLDMDVFAIAEAAGVSAPQPVGLNSRELLPELRTALALPNVRTFGIYEAAPLLDSNGDPTTRLAARCLWEALSLP